MDHSEIKHLPKTDHTPAELDKASTALLRAADYLERHGWRQWSHGVEGGPACMGGALNFVTCGTGDFHEAWQRLERSVGDMGTSWNDAEGRTKEEVVAKLRAVALGL